MTNSAMLEKKDVPDVTTEDVTYFETAKGYYARPKADPPTGGYPGVVMIHEWWGLNDTIKDTARQLAAEGYAVLAVDLYSGEVAATPERARELVMGLNQGVATNNLRAAAALLRSQKATKIASLGWCFGGGQSLQLALSGENLDATVIYYGNLVTDTQRLATIDWPVLGIFGADDASIPVATVNEFGSALKQIGVENSINIYPGVGHAFANPSGANYAAAETKDAWAKTLAFLAASLR